ncbi:MAG: hemolysin-type calcium-binding region, partial [Roseobacter sp.]
MATFYRYDAAILGSQSSQGVNGAAVDYRFAPSGNWSYTGSNTSFIVEEARDSNTRFDGDRTNEEISPNFQIGANRAQTVEVDGSDRQVIWDYTFE